MTTTTSQVSLPTLLPLCFMVFAAFVTVDRAVSAGLKRVLLASHDRYLRVYQPEPAATSVVVGDSRAGAHFPHSAHDQPQAFFNLGQGGMGLPMSGALLRDYIDTHGKPSQVIIETSFLADDGSGIAVAGLAQIYSTRVRHLVRQDDPASARISTWFHTLQFNHHRLIPALVGLFRERKSRIYRGHISREVIEEVNAWEPFRLEIPERNAQVLTDMVASLKAQNIEVVMVMTPLLPERIRKITNLGAFLDGVQALAEATGARFVNFIDHVREHRYFADSLHLNAQGRAIFLRDFWRQVGSPRSGHTPTYPTESRPPLPQWGVKPTHLHVP